MRLRIVRACQSSLSDNIDHFLKEEIKSHYLINKHKRPGIEFRAISDMLHCFMSVFIASISHVMMVQFHGCVKFRFIGGEHDQFPRILHFRLLFTGRKSQIISMTFVSNYARRLYSRNLSLSQKFCAPFL